MCRKHKGNRYLYHRNIKLRGGSMASGPKRCLKGELVWSHSDSSKSRAKSRYEQILFMELHTVTNKSYTAILLLINNELFF